MRRRLGKRAGRQASSLSNEIRLSHLAMHEASIELEGMEFGLFHVLPGSSLGRRASRNFELSDPLPIRGRRRLCLVSLHGSKSPPLPLAPWTSWYASSPRKLELCAGASAAPLAPALSRAAGTKPQLPQHKSQSTASTSESACGAPFVPICRA
jgi:hypothetical protein